MLNISNFLIDSFIHSLFFITKNTRLVNSKLDKTSKEAIPNDTEGNIIIDKLKLSRLKPHGLRLSRLRLPRLRAEVCKGV